MKTATLWAVISTALLSLITIYNFIKSIKLMQYIEDYSVLNPIVTFLNACAWGGLCYFFYTLYKKQPK